MKFVAGLYVENINFRTEDGPSTRIDIQGAFFSYKPASYPDLLTPHLVLLISGVGSDIANDTLVCEFRRGDEIIARNVQPCPIEIGKFGYRLVRPEIEFKEPETIIVTCTLTESKQSIEVPLTSL